MTAGRNRIEELARAVAEGTRVDWDAALAATVDADERRVVEQLHSAYERAHGTRTADGAERTVAPGSGAAGTGFSPGQDLGQRYRIQDLLGRGGMGEVWKAFDLKLRVDVALKSLLREGLGDERMLELLRHEVRSAREVMSPNVCRIFDLVEVDGRELVSMEYIDGHTLLDILRERGPLDLREATEIASQFLVGLEAIHAAGLVHRDVKPENIMLTRSGRVVLMDFGLAKPHASGAGGVAGTPAYMAPEALAGGALDARADIFAAGIVLAEMISAEGIRDRDSRRSLQRGVREDPPRLPDSPWHPVLRRAVAVEKEQRYGTVQDLIRALEEVTLRVEGAEDVRPYPGLATFTEEDAEYFFGRELEVESMWKKLQQPHLLALIGPSGAGKSSFIRAGLLPVMPTGWRCVVCHPGTGPTMALAGALAPEMAGDADVVSELLRFDDPDIAVSMFSRWRGRHAEALLVVDQFEELFTLNPPEVQARFAEQLGRLALDADVHVLLSMRDDFLFHCHAYPALSPIVSELTMLGPPTGAALRRALIQPALKCGYRFEDEKLAGEMLDEVAGERGALPMLAFAAARLWDERDRDNGLLTREAYERIGGVGGALAQHAEATLEKIGRDRIPLVRELFRNLVTAQGTRAARDRQELLSVFDEAERGAAGDVLDALIDARLLTSYESSDTEVQDAVHQRIEIIHESLLSAWPRLVRWQTQDADGAQLRDQLRQAAQMWDERGRSDDLLWSGTAYGEYELWRERYPGGLSATEESFGQAMTHHARRRRRRRRLAVGAAITLLLAVLAVVSWSGLEQRRARLRADAARLLALARAQPPEHPTARLAYTIGSLETVDTDEARRFAAELLWSGPMAFSEAVDTDPVNMEFSPDGRWLHAGRFDDMNKLWRQDGSPATTLTGGFGGFSGDSKSYITWTAEDDVEVWSLPESRLLNTLDTGPINVPAAFRTGGDASLLDFRLQNGDIVVRRWPLRGGEPEFLGRLPADVPRANWQFDVDPGGSRFAYAVNRPTGNADGETRTDLYVVSLNELDSATPRWIGGLEGQYTGQLWFHPDGRQIASLLLPTVAGDQSNTVALTAVSGDASEPYSRSFEEVGDVFVVANHQLGLDRGGRWVAAPQGGSAGSGQAFVWDLSAPPGADPLVLQRGSMQGVFALAMHPEGTWVAVGDTLTVSLWPLTPTHPHVLSGHGSEQVPSVVFDPDGEWIASRSVGSLRLWPLSGARGEEPRLLLERSGWGLAVSPDGQYLAVGSDEVTVVVPVAGGPTRELAGVAHLGTLDFDPTGRWLVGAGGNAVRVWDLHSNEVRALDVEEDGRHFSIAEFTQDGRVLLARLQMVGMSVQGLHQELRLWEPETGATETLVAASHEPDMTAPHWGRLKPSGSSRLLSPDGRYLLWPVEDGCFSVYDLEQRRRMPRVSTRVGCLELFAAYPVWHPSGRYLVMGSVDGVVRVIPVDGGEPHLLFGHDGIVQGLDVDPEGEWIVTGGRTDCTVRLWPMPKGRPFHTLPHHELLDRLRSLTNYRVVRDEESPGGYRVTFDRLPAWDEVPTW